MYVQKARCWEVQEKAKHDGTPPVTWLQPLQWLCRLFKPPELPHMLQHCLQHLILAGLCGYILYSFKETDVCKCCQPHQELGAVPCKWLYFLWLLWLHEKP
jgi:hypothetical protein